MQRGGVWADFTLMVDCWVRGWAVIAECAGGSALHGLTPQQRWLAGARLHVRDSSLQGVCGIFAAQVKTG
jgi:hypothetical protein